MVWNVLLIRAQITFTANDEVPQYQAPFGYGVNPGFYNGWDDESLADIAAGNPDLGVKGVGCNTMRPPLPEWFLEFWGYDIRLDEFQYYENLGMQDLTVFLGDPSDEHRDPNQYCPGYQSLLFDNMYLPIWDNGENGTPVNDDNYYAIYVYRTVQTYKDHVKFWEIWNEPDFDYSASGFLYPGQEGNWWENVPDPCDYKLRAPVYHYIRLLRISYEVIKYVDPEAFVAVGGLGFSSFLDIIMRHTDNPDNGLVSSDFPLKGGAYFDALSFHSYPHFSLKEYNNDIGGFEYFRYSDAAMENILEQRTEFEMVLHNYGYDGNNFPEKVWLITEGNVPAQNFNPNYFGSVEGQRNFIIKATIACQKNDILQYHIFKLSEDEPFGQGYNEFDRMGLYENIDSVNQYEQVPTEAGIAYKTTSDLIGDAVFDANQTEALNLPDNIDGAAFQHPDNSFSYVLWAKTYIDNTETANAVFSFPEAMTINLLEKRSWDFSQNNQSVNIGPNNIALNGTPIFLKDISVNGFPPLAGFDYIQNSVCAPYSVSFTDQSENDPTGWTWTFPGAIPASSNMENPVISFNDPGTYTVSLTVSNLFGSNTISQTIEIGTDHTGLLNTTLCFGDEMIVNGTVYNEANPHGTEIIENGSALGCDSTVIIDLSFDEILSSDTTVIICEGESYPFGNQELSEPDTYVFETSTEEGCDSIATLHLEVETSTTIEAIFSICQGESYNGIFYEKDTLLRSTILSVNGCDSIIQEVALEVLDTFYTELNVTISQGESYPLGNSSYSESGVYSALLMAQNGCDSLVILHLTVDIIDAIAEHSDPAKTRLQVFPNPFDHQINVAITTSAMESAQIELYDSSGRQIPVSVKSAFYQGGRQLYQLDGKALTSGVYWCKIQSDTEVFTVRLIKI